MPPQKFYAVLNGLEPGIYTSWAQTSFLVLGFKEAKYKSFTSLNEAAAYLNIAQGNTPGLSIGRIDAFIRCALKDCALMSVGGSKVRGALKRNHNEITSNPTTTEANPDNESVLEIYTDGACSGNGKKGARAGFGVWFGMNDSRNISQRVPGPLQTNNRAEMFAAIRALQTIGGEQNVRIYTDSKYLMQGLNEYVKKWKENGWKTAARSDVANRDLWIELDSLVMHRIGHTDWVHVFGHSGNPGNERADRLAVQGAQLPTGLNLFQ